MYRVIRKEEVMNLLLEACPSYKPYYEENLDDDGEQLLYLDIMEFVSHLIDLYKKNQINEFPRIFEVIELLHTGGDDFVKEAATIGLLESIQNMAGDEINPDVFKQYLKPESLKWWNNLDDFWNGKTEYVGGPRRHLSLNNEAISVRKSSNRKAIISLIFGILSIILFFLFFPVGFFLGILGLIAGIIGLIEINEYKQERRKIAIAGIVCSGLGIIIPIILVAIVGFVGFGPGLSDFKYPLSNGYELSHISPQDVVVFPKDGYTKESEIIPAKVVKIAWNNQFVIAEQQVIQEPKKSESGIGKLTNKFNYWILDTKIRQAYGPFNQKTFDEKLKEFGIPSSLKLKDVESYKKNY